MSKENFKNNSPKNNRKSRQEMPYMQKILITSIIFTCIAALIFVSYDVLLFLKENNVLTSANPVKIAELLNAISSFIEGIAFGFWIAYIFERESKKREERLKVEQQNYTLSSVKKSLLDLFVLEYKNFLQCLINPNATKITEIGKGIEIKNLLQSLRAYLDPMTKGAALYHHHPKNFDSKNEISLSRRNKLAFESSLKYYENLNRDLLRIYDDSSLYYMARVLTKEQLDNIQEIQLYVNLIIIYSNENNLDRLFYYKKKLFNRVEKIFHVVNIQPSDTVMCPTAPTDE